MIKEWFKKLLKKVERKLSQTKRNIEKELFEAYDKGYQSQRNLIQAQEKIIENQTDLISQLKDIINLKTSQVGLLKQLVHNLKEELKTSGVKTPSELDHAFLQILEEEKTT